MARTIVVWPPCEVCEGQCGRWRENPAYTPDNDTQTHLWEECPTCAGTGDLPDEHMPYPPPPECVIEVPWWQFWVR